ncbi:MAG: hypothetical protein ACLRQ0_09825 [Monoglobales bacterium]
MSDCGFDYNTVFHQMTLGEIREANAALDIKIKIEMQKKASKKK